MPEDFARATAAPSPTMIAGRTYLAGELTPRGFGDLQMFLKTMSPDPRKQAIEWIKEVAALKEIATDALQLEIWRTACEDAKSWPPSLLGEGAFLILNTTEGQAHVVWVALRDHNPGFTLDNARSIIELNQLRWEQFMGLFNGLFPDRAGDPKSQTPEAQETTPLPLPAA